MQPDPCVSRNIDASAVIQRGMEHRNRIIFGHVDFIQDSKAAKFRTLINRTFAELNFVMDKRISPN